jgi:hypothetical protein
MKRRKELSINTFQLNRLLDKSQQDGFRYLLENGVHCRTCNGICPGVRDYSLQLNDMNDVLVDGFCRTCGNQVVRLMEFGEDAGFFSRAEKLRSELP